MMNVNLQPGSSHRLIQCVHGFWSVSLFCLVFLSPVFPTKGEPVSPANHSYYIKTWTAEDGLPENRIVGVEQTLDGYLWVLTRGGLVRFDGAQFQAFEEASSAGFTTSTMWKLYLDRENRLWIAKEHGALVCLAGTNVLALTARDGLPQFGGQCSMAEDSLGSLWIAYNFGMVVRYKDGRLEDFTGKDGLPVGRDCLFATDRDGQLWFAQNGQVGLLRSGKFITLSNLVSHIIQIAPARSGGIWICAGHKVLKFNEGEKTVTLAELPTTRATAEPTALLEDSEGAVWVGTPDGLFRCDSNSVDRVQTSFPIISSLREDWEGDLWVGTQGGGLDRVQRRVVSLIGEAAGLPFEGVRSACQDASGALWAVSENGILARKQYGQWITLPFDKDMSSARARCVAADSKGTVWVGTDLGTLYQWTNGQFQKFDLGNDVHSGGLRSLFVTTSGDLWVAADALSTNSDLYRIRGGTVRMFELPPGYRFVRAMAEDAAGNIWVGASDGLLVRVAGDTMVDETTRYPMYSIRCLYGTPDGSLWIGYAGFGVGRLYQGKMDHFDANQGLPNDYVSQILADGKGGMWFAGNRGIFQVPERDFDDVGAGRATQLQPVFYGRSQGLPGLQASFDFYPSAVRDGSGRLYFSMLTGLAEVRTDRTRLNRLPPDVIIERVMADNQTFAVYQTAASQTGTPTPLELNTTDKNREITLPPGFQHILIKFTALSFVAPENVRFRYQLKGIDQNWVDAGTQRIAQYTRLPPGNYRFKVIACNNDGIWNNTGATIDITLEPYIWETLWFKILGGTGIVGVFCGSFVLALRRHHRLQIQHLERQQALERERARIARDLHDDLGIGLTEIGLLGDLASAPPASNSSETRHLYLREITGRARELVVMLDEIVWAINPAHDTSQSLSDYFLKFAQTLLHRASIRCRLEVAEPFPNCSLNAEERHQFFLAFKEALNNVVRHSGATEVQIGLGFVANELVIKVEDNGRGLTTMAAQGSSDGLTGMQERLHRLGGRCEIAGGANGGTCVKLVIRVRSSKDLCSNLP